MSGGSDNLGRGDQLATLSGIWLLLLGMGIALIVLGFAAIGSAFIATLATVIVFGVQLIVAGILEIAASFWGRCWRGFFSHLLAGIFYLFAGILLIDHPFDAAKGITLVIAVALLVGGLFRIILSLSERFQGWELVLLNGIVSLLLGISIWKQWPSSAVWVIGLFVGIELLFTGLSWVMLALAVRAVPRPAVPATP